MLLVIMVWPTFFCFYHQTQNPGFLYSGDCPDIVWTRWEQTVLKQEKTFGSLKKLKVSRKVFSYTDKKLQMATTLGALHILNRLHLIFCLFSYVYKTEASAGFWRSIHYESSDGALTWLLTNSTSVLKARYHPSNLVSLSGPWNVEKLLVINISIQEKSAFVQDLLRTIALRNFIQKSQSLPFGCESLLSTF